MARFNKSHTSSYSFSIVTMSIFYRHWDIQRRIIAWPWNLGQGSLRSLTRSAAVAERSRDASCHWIFC